VTAVAGVARAGAGAPATGRIERFASVASTNDVVRGWLAAGEPEVCIAIAEEQTAGRGRNGRTWTAPRGAGLLLSAGFRPTWLAPDRVWRLAAIVSLAMAEAAEAAIGRSAGSIGLKWPNDLVVTDGGRLLKVGGVLGETDGLGGDDPRAIVGIGINVNWPAAEAPAELAGLMTSLQELNGGRPIDQDRLFAAFRAALEVRLGELRAGRFDASGWADRQVTTGRSIEIVRPDGTTEHVVATGVDIETGALHVVDPGDGGPDRPLFVGEIRRVRLARV
jgi:BirA family biotin operon repressor/biotin-[acetyl-CoA-carboxylase] ligase